jgi:hypothetical protein
MARSDWRKRAKRIAKRGAAKLAKALRGRRGAVTIALAVLFVAMLSWAIWSARQPGPWQHVFATREGEIGKRTSTGLVIARDHLFVALPHPSALGRSVEVRYRDRALVVPVLDVGPWNVDDAYWETGTRPAAERGRGAHRTPSNHAGIDLSDAVFAALGLHDNDYVEWRFVHRGYVVLPRL